MGAYIKVTLPKDTRLEISFALRQVLCYIGSDTSRDNYLSFDREDYEKGVERVNRRLRKWCKTSIKRMVYCKECRKDEKYEWKLHRVKTTKILRAIKCELEKKAVPDDIRKLFKEIYFYLRTLLKGDVEREASEILSRSYIRGIRRACFAAEYDEQEKEDLKRIIDTFESYNKYPF